MKRVFSSNAQLAHVWAQQTQDYGRGNSLFFERDTIWSFGYHYKAAKIHAIKGKPFALVNSDRYSSCTGKHLNYITSALQGLMPYFHAPDVTSPRDAVKHLDEKAQEQIAYALKRIKIESKRDIQWQFQSIREAFQEANKLRKFLGKAEKFASKKQLDAVQSHLEFRLKRYHELNTPEMQAKREAERLKRIERKEALERASQAEKIQFFREGRNVGIYGLSHEILRIKGDEIETSRGAKVPLDHAKLLYRAIKQGKSVEDQRIGHFRVNAVTDLPSGDKEIRVGCHRILLSEASLVLEPRLQLVAV